MSQTEVLIGYGSLLSKKGITREGTSPHIHRAWVATVPGQRGFSNPIRGGRKLVMDAFLDEARILHLNPLPHFVTGGDAPTARSTDLHEDDTQPSFHALALEVDQADWDWFDAREEFPAGLGRALARDARSAGTPIGALLGHIMASAGFEGFPGALYDRYRDRLDDPDPDTFHAAYLPYPMRLPDQDDQDHATDHKWGIICAVPRKHLTPLSVSAAAARPGCDAAELLPYYHDAMLGCAHGLDLSDLHDAEYEAQHPELDTWRAHDRPREAEPLTSFLGNIPKGALPPNPNPTHGMHPLGDLIPYDEAMRRITRAHIHPTDAEDVDLDDAVDRVVAADVFALHDQPDAPKCAMDGYAVRAEDTYGASIVAPRIVRCTAAAPAGADTHPEVTTGTCVQVATGSVLPRGADAVVMVEATTAEGDEIRIHRPHHPGQNVTPPGSDWHAGDELIPAGARLDAGRMAAVAANGITHLPVHQKPRVAILSTGDEVVAPGDRRRVGQVYDSNAWGLRAFVTAHGGEPHRLRPVMDDVDRLRDALDAAARRHDLILVTGGTSAGARDLLPDLVRANGKVLFHGVKMRPGKPVLVGQWGRTWLVGLPGYPTSCLITAACFVRPLLARIGGTELSVRGFDAELAEPLRSKRGLRQFVPVEVDADGRARTVFRGSGAVSSLSNADGLVEIAEDTTLVEAGAKVCVTPLD